MRSSGEVKGDAPVRPEALDLVQQLLSWVGSYSREGSLFCSEEEASFFSTEPHPTVPVPLPFPKRQVERNVSVSPQATVKMLEKKRALPLPVATPERVRSPEPSSLLFRSMDTLLKRVAPGLPLLEKVPDDARAKQLEARWKISTQVAPITLLSFAETSSGKIFFEEMGHALDLYFGPAKVVAAEPIERDHQWETLISTPHLRWVITCDYTLWQLPRLKALYREQGGNRSLHNTPLFLLPDLSLYLKDPSLKRSLWKTLCQTLSS